MAGSLVEMEQALASRESKYANLKNLLAAIADNAPDYVWAKDRDSKYLFINKAVQFDLFRTDSLDSLLGKTDQEIEQDKRDRGFNDFCVTVISDYPIETGTGTEIYLKKINNNEVNKLLHVYRSKLWDDDGKVYGYISTARDVSTLVEICQQLAEVLESEEWADLREALVSGFSNFNKRLEGVI